MSENGLTYSGSGVDIDKEVDAIHALRSSLSFTREGIGSPADIGGHFTGLIEFGENYLSMCTDGVGSKLMIADAVEKWDTVGIDCVAMNVNDMICIGAEPLAMVDYIAIDDPQPELLGEIAKGLNEGMKLSNTSLIGGETASLPDIVKGFDIAGTCLGYVPKDKLIDGSKVIDGDVIIGIPSSGIHSNGFSLVRKAVETSDYDYTTKFETICKDMGIEEDAEFLQFSLGEAALIPTRIYVKPIIQILKENEVHGLVHVTGGGLKNLPRIKSDVDYVITDPLPVLPIFRVIQKMGNISDLEMFKTFNMGMGFCIVCPQDQAERILEQLKDWDSHAEVIGRVEKGTGLAKHVPLGLEYSSL